MVSNTPTYNVPTNKKKRLENCASPVSLGWKLNRKVEKGMVDTSLKGCPVRCLTIDQTQFFKTRLRKPLLRITTCSRLSVLENVVRKPIVRSKVASFVSAIVPACKVNCGEFEQRQRSRDIVYLKRKSIEDISKQREEREGGEERGGRRRKSRRRRRERN